MVLLQFAVEMGPITLWDVWKKPIGETLDLIEWICQHTVVGFNLAFDWFHIVKLYTVFSLCPRDWIPEEHIDEIAMLEPQAQDGPCVKPANALDLLLHSRKGPYQSLMAREDIRIRRVPTALAYALAAELESELEIDSIYFARSADKDAPRWQVFDVKDRNGDIDPDFKDVCLRFNPAGGLKYLAEHALHKTPKYHYKDVEPDPAWFTKKCEIGYAPTALAMSSPEENWEIWQEKDGERKLVGHAWPAVIHKFIEHWSTRADARDYANDDIVYTRELDYHFGCPKPGDDDSILACMVPVIRWHGFKIDIEGMKQLLAKAEAVVANSPVNCNKPAAVRAYLKECLCDTEMLMIETSTNKKNLEKYSQYKVTILPDDEEDEDEPENEVLRESWDIREHEHCEKCNGTGLHTEGFCKDTAGEFPVGYCHRCQGRGHLLPGEHPAAKRAKVLLLVKAAVKEVELYKKLIKAGKFHASFNVVGTLSSRMSGGDGLNAQGIKASDEVRCMFPLAWDGYELCGGDFDSFEVVLASAVYKDPQLHETLTTRVPCHECNGALVCRTKKCKRCKGTGTHPCAECEGCGKTTKKIHALFGMELFNCSYEEIMADKVKYGKAKAGVFAMTYGGNAKTLQKNLSVSLEIAEKAYAGWGKRYPGIGKSRKRIEDAFGAMRQPGGIGSMIVWADPKEYVESFLGFRRYFTLENKICRVLFDLARKPPKEWRDCKIKVMRSVKQGRIQTGMGATASALYGAAFGIQQNNVRAAANHEIQSPGGQITKHVQRAIWDLQPAGVHMLLVAPMNVHDELMTVTHPTMVQAVTKVVRAVVESYRPKVPLIGMTWFEAMKNWAEKKDGAEAVKIRAPELMAA